MKNASSTDHGEGWIRQSNFTSPVRILYIDGDGDGEPSATRLEHQQPFQIVTKSGTENILTLIDEEQIDCIVSRHHLPNSNGLEVLKTVREEYPELPFILSTDSGDEGVVSEAISADVSEYLEHSESRQWEKLAAIVADLVEDYRKSLEYRELFNAVNAAVLVYDATSFDVVGVNSSASNLWGYSQEELKTQSIDDLSSDDSNFTKERAHELFERTLEEGERSVNWKCEGADGNSFWAELTMKPVTLGGQHRLLLVAHDISELKARESALQTERDRFAILWQHIDVPLAETVFEEDYPLIQGVNPAFERTFGVDGDAVIGESLDDLIVPAECESDADEFNECVREGEQFETEVQRDAVDGTRDFLLTVVPFGDPSGADQRGGFAIYIDLTEQKRRERQLKAFTKTTPDITFIVDEEGYTKECFVGPDHEEHLYLPAETLRDQQMQELLPEDLGRQIFSTIKKTLETGDVQTLEYELNVPAGDRWFEARIAPLQTRIDGKRAVVLTARDVTERQRREEELQRKNDRLEEFASVVSHDLQNPLSVATGFLELAREDGDPEQFDRIEVALDRMERIIDDLLYLARENQQIGELESVDLQYIASSAWETVLDTNSAGELVLHNDLGEISADDDRLSQLFENIFRNAIEHGGSDVRIWVEAIEDGFAIADNGPGISKSDRDRVFERGFTSQDDGTGFGLYIVREIVDGHGWDITISESTAGGARFEISDADIQR
ncbi:PAS domain S-box protein [Halobellus salinisoli]|uniref:PAS domain S-box protein n=1 Tax=Halobellus salinisoli TaxID=3108500 RepID=UPI00300AF16A